MGVSMSLLHKALFGMVFVMSFALVPTAIQAQEAGIGPEVGAPQDEGSLAWRRWGYYGPGFYRPVGYDGYYYHHPYWYHHGGARVYWR